MLGISPNAIPPQSSHPLLSLPWHPTPQQSPVCDVPLTVSMCSHCSTPTMNENMQCLVFCSCVSLLRMMVSRFIHVPTKEHKLIFFDCCIIFHGVYVPHFPSSVYHRWAFGLVPGLCYCKQCCKEHSCACVLIVERFIVLWIYTQ